MRIVTANRDQPESDHCWLVWDESGDPTKCVAVSSLRALGVRFRPACEFNVTALGHRIVAVCETVMLDTLGEPVGAVEVHLSLYIGFYSAETCRQVDECQEMVFRPDRTMVAVFAVPVSPDSSAPGAQASA